MSPHSDQPVESPPQSAEPQAAPLPIQPAYEPPTLELVGHLSNLLGKSGSLRDATYRRPSSGRS